jgi:hypothetical protein
MILPAQGSVFRHRQQHRALRGGRLIRDGKIRRSYIGVAGQNVPIPRAVGARQPVGGVVGGARGVGGTEEPAAGAGLREGDLIWDLPVRRSPGLTICIAG